MGGQTIILKLVSVCDFLQPYNKVAKAPTNDQHLNNYLKYLHNNYMPTGKARSELRLCSHFDGK